MAEYESNLMGIGREKEEGRGPMHGLEVVENPCLTIVRNAGPKGIHSLVGCDGIMYGGRKGREEEEMGRRKRRQSQRAGQRD